MPAVHLGGAAHANHRYGYQLPPTEAELRAWMSLVREVVLVPASRC